jgi:hypothetical protein
VEINCQFIEVHGDGLVRMQCQKMVQLVENDWTSAMTAAASPAHQGQM